MNKSVVRMMIILCAMTGLLLAPPLRAERIRDLTTVLGVRENALIGYGLVVGLDGTGDQTTQTPFTTQSLRNMLSQLGVTVPAGTNMQLKNVAAVMVTAKLPAFARAGQKIDVVVSSLGSAKSLRGGTLLMTPLKGVDNQVYALAQGNILFSGSGAQAGGSRVQANQLNGGRITGGAIVERSVPADFAGGNVIMLQLNNDDFTPAQQAARDSGLPHQLIVAQAALESGWGAREIKTAHGAPSHNLFGIKADAGWQGESTQITTTEWVDGVMQKVKAKFRVYASYGDALRDYTRLLTENPRYRRVMQARTPEQAARSLQSSGYATDPHYADKLINIIAQLKSCGQRAQAAYQHDLATLF